METSQIIFWLIVIGLFIFTVFAFIKGVQRTYREHTLRLKEEKEKPELEMANAVEQTKENMSAKSAGELLEILKENDTGKYSEETFEDVEQILLRRGLPLPRRAAQLQISQTNTVDRPDNPWDQQSLQLMNTLPKRTGSLAAFLPFLKLAAAPFIFLGGIGTFKQIAPVLSRGAEYEYAVQHFGAHIFLLVLALGILGIGGALWRVSEIYTFEKAPLGSLIAVMVEGIAHKKNLSKIRRAALSACREADKIAGDALAVLLAKGLANEILAETSTTLEEAKGYASKAIPLFQQAINKGLNTPLLWFGLATSHRIAEQSKEAIVHYETYLDMRPQDDGTRKIMDGLKTQRPE